MKIPQLSLADKLLRILGKKRGLLFPSGQYKKFGPYAIGMAGTESFFRALFRSKNEDLPDGMIDIFMFDNTTDIDDE